jgi:hypothetical protein
MTYWEEFFFVYHLEYFHDQGKHPTYIYSLTISNARELGIKPSLYDGISRNQELREVVVWYGQEPRISWFGSAGGIMVRLGEAEEEAEWSGNSEGISLV